MPMFRVRHKLVIEYGVVADDGSAALEGAKRRERFLFPMLAGLSASRRKQASSLVVYERGWLALAEPEGERIEKP